MGFLEDYEPVATRLARFWAEHPDGRVITDLVHYLADTAVFKADIYIGDTLVATGWEEEIRGSSNVNKTSHLANCETSAIGRALANLGYAGSDPSKRPSREEMAKVERAKSAHPSAGMSGGMTENQERAIRAMSKAMGKLPPIMEGWTKAQASACIDQLKAEQQADPPEEPF